MTALKRQKKTWWHHSDKIKRNLSEIAKNLSTEKRRKISEAHLRGKKHPMYGKHWSDAEKNLISIKTKEAMKNPLIREKISKAQKGKKKGPLSEETKRKISESQKGDKGYWYGKKMPLEHRKKISEGNKGKTVSLESRRKLSKSLKGKYVGEKSHNFGKSLPLETKQKISISRKKRFKEKGFLNTVETKKKISKSLKEYYKTHPGTMTGRASPNKGIPLSLERKRKLSIIAKKRWLNKEYVEKLRKSMKLKPNNKEKILINLFKEHKLDYRFVGDLSFIIERKNPDFVNCNGQKKIIELFGDYWHNNPKTKYHQTETGTKEHYAKYGWKTLVIWEKELKDLDGVLEKVMRFDKI